jgi:hypothetical protein
VDAVVLATVAIAVAPFSPGVSLLALGASPGVYPLGLGASSGVPAASARAYPPWCQPSAALSSSVLQQLGHLRLVEAVEDPSISAGCGWGCLNILRVCRLRGRSIPPPFLVLTI